MSTPRQLRTVLRHRERASNAAKATLAAALLLLISSCARASEGETFGYEMVTVSDVDVDVRTGAGPVAGALVYVRPDDGGPPLFQAATQSDGHARGKLTGARTFNRLSVVIQRPGLVGPWSAPSPREAYGPFAPSSWTMQPARSLSSLVVELRSL